MSLEKRGWRIAGFVQPGGRVVLKTRSGRNVADQFLEITSALAEALGAGTVLDGELAAHDSTSLAFTQLGARHACGLRRDVTYIAFDLLADRVRDVRDLSLHQPAAPNPFPRFTPPSASCPLRRPTPAGSDRFRPRALRHEDTDPHRGKLAAGGHRPHR